MSLYAKYRPPDFSSLYGNEEIINTLNKMVLTPKTIPHSFLLTGPTGCGKTTIARIIANTLNCTGDDLREVDSADFRGIDTIREIRKQVLYRPLQGDYRIWILDECHKMSNDAQSALLKTLEDTPSHVIFILCTTDPQKLLPTIKGRCSQFQVKPLNELLMYKLLRKIAKAEGVSLEKEIYDQIIMDSFGHPRNAIQTLEQVLHVDEDKRLQTAKRSAEEQSESIELCRALLSNTGWKKVADILSGLKEQEPESIRRHVLGYCQAVLLKTDNPKAGLVMELFIEPFYNTGFAGLVFACYSVVKN